MNESTGPSYEIISGTEDHELLYPYNISAEYDEDNEQARVLLTGLFYGIAFVAGVLGNGMIIYIVARNARMRTLSNVFLASLAVADLLLVLGCIPVKFIQLSTHIWELGDFACHAFHYVQTISAFCSVMTLTTMSLERYYAIIHPVRCRVTFSMRHIKKLIASIWILAGICALPTWFVYVLTPVRDEYIGGDYYWCVKVDPIHAPKDQPSLAVYWWRLRLAFEIYMIVFILVLPALVMSFTYSRICVRLWTVVHHRTAMRYGHASHHIAPSKSINSNGKVATSISASHALPPAARNSAARASMPSNAINPRQQQSIEEDNQTVKSVIKMLVAVMLVFLICWTPTLILSMLRAMDITIETNEGFLKHIATVVYLLQYLNSVIDPFIYGFMSKNFRLHFKQITMQVYHCVCHCRWSSRLQQHRYYYAQSRYAPRRVVEGDKTNKINGDNACHLTKYSIKPIILFADNNNNASVTNRRLTDDADIIAGRLNTITTNVERPTTLGPERLAMPAQVVQLAITSPSTPSRGDEAVLGNHFADQGRDEEWALDSASDTSRATPVTGSTVT